MSEEDLMESDDMEEVIDNEKDNKNKKESCEPGCKCEPGHNIKHFFSNGKRFRAERQVFQLGILTFATIAVAMLMLYFGVFRFIPDFATKYAAYMVYIAISTAVIGVGVWHTRAYRHTFNCSMGMMVGMTIGMMSGFLLGTIIGATNGMFMGSVFGMLTGMFIGAWSTRTCGIMSIMEGLMAGLMGGLMGAMTTVMMLNDNIMLFMPLLVGSIVAIMIGMSLMIYKESGDHRDTVPKSDIYDRLSFVSLMFMLAMLTMFIMIYGPKSFIFI
ncbi:MAG: hypothetical protein ABIA21_02515 [Candidatus Aenigmatarchaeota archaeon]